MFWAIAGATLAISATFAALGYWLTLPFAGVEIGVLAWAFQALGRRSGDFETLTIRGDEVRLARKRETRIERFEFNRQWVSLIQDRRGARVRVALRSHGRETEVGVFLDDDGRRALGKQLQAWLRAGK